MSVETVHPFKSDVQSGPVLLGCSFSCDLACSSVCSWRTFLSSLHASTWTQLTWDVNRCRFCCLQIQSYQSCVTHVSQKQEISFFCRKFSQ